MMLPFAFFLDSNMSMLQLTEKVGSNAEQTTQVILALHSRSCRSHCEVFSFPAFPEATTSSEIVALVWSQC